jgi:hypothetical protein
MNQHHFPDCNRFATSFTGAQKPFRPSGTPPSGISKGSTEQGTVPTSRASAYARISSGFRIVPLNRRSPRPLRFSSVAKLSRSLQSGPACCAATIFQGPRGKINTTKHLSRSGMQITDVLFGNTVRYLNVCKKGNKDCKIVTPDHPRPRPQFQLKRH